MGRHQIRTGIDLGCGAVKLVRGFGGERFSRVTHVAVARVESGSEEEGLSQALGRVLSSTGLGRRELGRLAVAVKDQEAAVREVIMPAMEEEELRAAVPFEARRQLGVEPVSDTVFGFQVLGSAGKSGTAGDQVRVLVAAVPRTGRDQAVACLAEAGLEPDAIDMEPLAALNGVPSTLYPEGDSRAFALLDLGYSQTGMSIAQPDGYVLWRSLGPGIRNLLVPEDTARFADSIGTAVRETTAYYRSRYREQVGRFGVAGAGTRIETLCESIGSAASVELEVLDPFKGLEWESGPPPWVPRSLCAVAVGLCRRWDDDI